MYIVKVEGKRRKIPTSWQDVTVIQYAELLRAFKQEEVSEIEGLSRMKSIIDICVDDLDAETIGRMIPEVVFQVFDIIKAFVSEVPQYEYIESFEFNGTWYLPQQYMKDGTFDQWCDCMLFESQVDEFTQKNRFDILPDLIAILTKRDGETFYDSNLQAERRDLFKDLPMSIALQVDFFLQTRAKALKDMRTTTGSGSPEDLRTFGKVQSVARAKAKGIRLWRNITGTQH